jgi:hypothetical protein
MSLQLFPHLHYRPITHCTQHIMNRRPDFDYPASRHFKSYRIGNGMDMTIRSMLFSSMPRVSMTQSLWISLYCCRCFGKQVGQVAYLLSEFLYFAPKFFSLRAIICYLAGFARFGKRLDECEDCRSLEICWITTEKSADPIRHYQ